MLHFEITSGSFTGIPSSTVRATAGCGAVCPPPCAKSTKRRKNPKSRSRNAVVICLFIIWTVRSQHFDANESLCHAKRERRGRIRPAKHSQSIVGAVYD